VEEGERPEETALREVEEETGIKGKIVDYVGEISYWYTLKRERIFKRVKYYLMEYSGGKERPSWEALDVKFFPEAEVKDLLKYKGDKEIFQKALLKRGNLFKQ